MKFIKASERLPETMERLHLRIFSPTAPMLRTVGVLEFGGLYFVEVENAKPHKVEMVEWLDEQFDEDLHNKISQLEVDKIFMQEAIDRAAIILDEKDKEIQNLKEQLSLANEGIWAGDYKEKGNASLGDNINTAVDAIAEAVFYHAADSSHNKKLKAALRLFAKTIMLNNEQVYDK